MAQRRGFPARIQTSKKRQVAWGLGPNAVDMTGAASNSAVWSNGIGLVTDAEVTIVRIRGSFMVFLESFTAANDGFTGAIGIGIVNSQAFAAGIVSMPTPITESDWGGWMWHQFF